MTNPFGDRTIDQIEASGEFPQMVARFKKGEDLVRYGEGGVVFATEMEIGKRVKNFDAHVTLADGRDVVVRFGDLKFVAGPHPRLVRLYNNILFRQFRCREKTWGGLQIAFSGTSDQQATKEQMSWFEREHTQ